MRLLRIVLTLLVALLLTAGVLLLFFSFPIAAAQTAKSDQYTAVHLNAPSICRTQRTYVETV